MIDTIIALIETRIGSLSIVGRRLSEEEQSEVDRLTRGLEAMRNGPQPPAPIGSRVSDLRPEECSDATSGREDEAAG